MHCKWADGDCHGVELGMDEHIEGLETGWKTSWLG
jgi:hypothetical protein